MDITDYDDPGDDIDGLWIITKTGQMLYLRVPIRVICIVSVKDFHSGITYYVEAVLRSDRGYLVYFIFNIPVRHSYFRIKDKS